MNRRMRIVVFVAFSVSAWAAGAACGTTVSIDADAFSQWTDMSMAFDGIILSSVGTWGGLDGRVYARRATQTTGPSTGSNVFGNNVEGVDSRGVNRNETWAYPHAVLSTYFSEGADYVAIDVIADQDTDWAAMSVFDIAGRLLDTAESPILTTGQIYRLELSMDGFDIAYMSVSGVGGSAVYLDNLTANVPEPAAAAILGVGAALIRLRRRG